MGTIYRVTVECESDKVSYLAEMEYEETFLEGIDRLRTNARKVAHHLGVGGDDYKCSVEEVQDAIA